MKITFMPRTSSGKWAAILGISFIILVTLKMFSFPMLSISIAFFGFAGFATGIIAIFKKDLSIILVFLSILIGLIIILWTTAEILYPH